MNRLVSRTLFSLLVFSFLFLGGQARGSGLPPIAVVAPEAYEGALMLQSSVEDQTSRAGLIVVGRVTKVTSRAVPGSIVTDITIDVEKSLKGSAGGSLAFTIEGGSSGGKQLFVAGAPNFMVSERVLLFLRSNADRRLVQLWQSKFSLAGSEAIQLESDTRLPIADIEKRISDRLKKPVVIGSSQETTTTVIGFTTYCLPWGSSSLPVPFEVNAANPAEGGPPGTDFARLAYNSWHNWQALSDSYPAFRLTGMTTLRDGTDHLDAINTVAYRDLDSSGTGVIGLNYCTMQGSNRIDSDTLIDNTGWT